MDRDLNQKAISGMIWGAIEKFGVKIINFISNIVLARLLTPEDYGCIGMLMIFILLAMTLVEGGFASAIIQKKDASKEDESTTFFWNLFISILLYIVLYFSAESIALFYRIPKLEIVLQVQGIILLVNSFGIIHINLLRKNFQFKKLAIINTASALLSMGLALLLAAYGFGIWALVYQQIALNLCTTILSWYYSRWKPSWVFSWKSFKSLFGYGSFLLLSNLLNTLCDNLQGIIIGKKFSPVIMGYYTQAKKLEEVPTTSLSSLVTQVTFPLFSKVQDNKEFLYTMVKKSLLLMNFVNFPLMILLIVIAKPLVLLLLTDKWLDVVPYFQILCVAGIVNCAQSINYQVVLAVGRSSDIFIWNIVKRTIGIMLIVLGMFYGINGILCAMVFSFYITYIINAVVATSTTGYNLLAQIKDMLPLLLVSLFAAFLASIFNNYDMHPLLSITLEGITFMFLYLLLSYFVKRDILINYYVIISKYLKK